MKTCWLALVLPLLSACQVYLRADSALLVERDHGVYALAPGDRMHRGDKLAIVVLIDRPAYVYVVHVDSRGVQVRLFPEQGEEPLSAGLPLRVPSRGFFSPDPGARPGTFVVVIDRQPVAPLALRDHVLHEARGPKRPRPLHLPRRVAASDPPALGDVRGADDIRSVANALGTRVEMSTSGTATLSLWLSPAE